MRVERARASSFWRSLLGALSRKRLGRHAGLEGSADLLLSCLSAAQRSEFERSRSFTVRAGSGRRYRIGFGTVANIEVLGERDDVEYRLCAGPAGLPTHAVMLAQKLMLESREAEFLRIAARHPSLAMPRGWEQPRL